jgi:hypothetical protein
MFLLFGFSIQFFFICYFYCQKTTFVCEFQHTSQTSRSLENNCHPYVFHRLVVSCEFCSTFLQNFYYKYERLLYMISSRNLFALYSLIFHVLRASPFHVYHTIETHITSVCKINMKITFQQRK